MSIDEVTSSTASAARPVSASGRGAALFKVGLFALLIIYAGFIAALLIANISYMEPGNIAEVLRDPDLRFAARLTLWTSLLSAALAVFFAVPVAYALSRYDFPGKALVDTLVDMPIVLPNIVVGVTLLVFFQTAPGRALEGTGFRFVYTRAGIVLAQFICVAPYAVRTVAGAFSAVDKRLEDVARTLGWSAGQVFRRVTLPMVRGGIVAGGVIAWALAIGLYGPLMVFTGTTRQVTEVLSTSIYLELSIGRIGPALAISMLMVAFTMASLIIFKLLAGGQSLW